MEPNKGKYEHLPQGGITSTPAHIWGQPAGKQLCSSRPGCPGGQQVDQEPAVHSHSQAALRKSVASRTRESKEECFDSSLVTKHCCH